jgi:hypothetical protein
MTPAIGPNCDITCSDAAIDKLIAILKNIHLLYRKTVININVPFMLQVVKLWLFIYVTSGKAMVVHYVES